VTDFNTAIIEEFRANGGHVRAHGFGDSLILVHNVGARSGQERISPLMALRDGDAWLIAASAAGAAKHPAWYFNLVATPETSIEVGVDGAVETIPVTAAVLEGEERDAAWNLFTSSSPGFASYEQRAAGRIIPVVRLAPR
jgi:deazaflavin-dependent oxidoreductase (nitroreductase family)